MVPSELGCMEDARMLKPSTHNTCGRQIQIWNNSTSDDSFLEYLLALQVSAAPLLRPDEVSDI